MTPKRLGIALVALVALWSLVGPAEVPQPRLVPGISGVEIALAGDPDQYTNKPVGGAQAPPDTIPVPSPSGPVLGGGPHPAPRSTLIVVVQAMTSFLWGKWSLY